MDGHSPSFEWDPLKNEKNMRKHGVTFDLAQFAFADPKRVILKDLEHSGQENRYFCLGKVAEGILTVRFTMRDTTIRIFGAGYWRKVRKIYEEENTVY